VAVLGQIDPFRALMLALTNPDRYSEILTSSHNALMGFGGAFLLMVALKYFFDVEKEIHWVHVIEAPLVKLGKLEAAEIAITLLALLGVSSIIAHDAMGFLIAGIFG